MLNAHDKHYFATLKEWRDQGAEIYIGGPAVGALSVSEDMMRFGRDQSRSLSPELKQSIVVELDGTDNQLNLQQTQKMLTTMERFPTAVHRSHIAKQDRLDAAMNDDHDAEPGPTLS